MKKFFSYLKTLWLGVNQEGLRLGFWGSGSCRETASALAGQEDLEKADRYKKSKAGV